MFVVCQHPGCLLFVSTLDVFQQGWMFVVGEHLDVCCW
jgi:hypothetical protein